MVKKFLLSDGICYESKITREKKSSRNCKSGSYRGTDLGMLALLPHQGYEKEASSKNGVKNELALWVN